MLEKVLPLVKSKVVLNLSGGATGGATTGASRGPVQVGYAAATVTSGTTPYGVALFRFTQNGVVVSEAAVPASPPTTAARIFVDYGAGVPAIPGRLEEGLVDIGTGIAVVNRGSAAANVTYTLRNTAGEAIASGHGKIAERAHFAKFIHELKDVAPDFVMPDNFATAARFGSLDVASDQPISVLALRLTNNQRGEALLTTTPIADLTRPQDSAPLYFPQFVDGGGYVTTLMLLNTSEVAETGKLALFDDSGSPLLVNQVGGTRGSDFDYAIGAGGIFVFQADGFPTEARVGWARLMPDTGTAGPVGAGVFSFSQGGIRVTESGVPAALPTTHARIYINESGNRSTGLAIANPDSSGLDLKLKAFHPDGSIVTDGGESSLSLDTAGHTARFVSQFMSGLPAGFTGVLDISSESPFAALTLRALTNSRGEFLLTTFPVADQTRAAPAPMVFPQIADGGGYVTEFILMSSAGPASLSIDFYDEDGVPLPVGK
jgi:hypothetical protein